MRGFHAGERMVGIVKVSRCKTLALLVILCRSLDKHGKSLESIFAVTS